MESLGTDFLGLVGERARRRCPSSSADARVQADKLVEPKTHHVKLGGATLRTPDEVKAWVAKTKRELLEQIKQGPIVIG